MKCEYCENQIPNNSTKCPSCGAAVTQQTSNAYQSVSTKGVFTEEDAFRARIGHYKPYYQTIFTKMFNSKGTDNGGWNWWAFLFGWIWGFSKGIMVPSIIMLVVTIITSGTGAFVGWIYFGIRGNKLYYEKCINQKDLYI